jgi:hypothetical protein
MGILTDINDTIKQADKELKESLMNKYNSLSLYFANCRGVWSYKEKCPYCLIEGGAWLGISLKRNIKYYQNEFTDRNSQTITIPDWIDFRLPGSYTTHYKKTGKKTVINVNVSTYFENYAVHFEDGSLEKEYDNVILKIVHYGDMHYAAPYVH